MIKQVTYILLTFCAALAVSCTKAPAELQEAKAVSISIAQADVKTAFNPAHTSIKWEEGDLIGIFHNAGAGHLQNQRLEYKAAEDLSVNVPVSADRIYGTYPYSPAIGNDPAQALLNIPQIQTQTDPGQLDGANYPMSASGKIEVDNVRLTFAPMAVMFAFNIYSTAADGEEAVSQITVIPTKNSNFAGSQTIDLTAEEPVITKGTISSGVTLKVANPQPLDAYRPSDDQQKSYSKQLYLTLARQSYTYVTIKVTTTAGKMYTMQTNSTQIDGTKDEIILLNVNLATKRVSRIVQTGTEELIEIGENDISNLGFEDITIEGTKPQASEMTCPQEMDFSRVGYHWSDDEIPSYPAYGKMLTPSGGDDYEMLQGAIDNFSGNKGAIVLGPGTFRISKGLSLWKSGLVLRGTKEGDMLKTTIYKTGNGSEDVITVGGKAGTYSKQLDMSCAGRITDAHTPVGAMWVNVENADRFNPGDRVCICRYPNEKWIQDIRMTEEHGLEFPWKPTAFYTQWERVVLKVEGSRVYLDNPVVMAIDDIYGGGYLIKCHPVGIISESGVEDLLIDCEYDPSVKQNDYYSFYMEIDADERHAHTAVKFVGCEHCWAVNVESHHMYFACVQFGTACKNCTALSCRYLEPVSTIEGSRRYAFSIGNAQLCLVKNCHADQARHSYITTGDNPGPNVFTQSSGTNSFAETGPHNKWSTGTLYDHLVLTGLHSHPNAPSSVPSTPSAGDDYYGSTDRWFGLLRIQDAYNYGSTDSQGWTGANLVFWNCESEIYVCENPWVTSQNWAWGCTGVYKTKSNSSTAAEGRNEGNIHSHGAHIILDGHTSLYEYQLAKRHSEGIRQFIPGFQYN